MRYQQKSYSCGPAALLNAIKIFEKKITESKIRKLSSCSEDGTDENGLITAIRQLNYTASTHWSADQTAAWSFIRANVMDGRPCLVCIDQWQHWVTIIGIIGDKVILIDPSNSKKNTSENGVFSLNRFKMIKRLKCSSETQPFYIIAIGK